MAEWRRAGFLNVFHYGEGRECRLGYQLLEDAARYEDYPNLRQPALVFHGAHDDVVPLESSQTFALGRPNVRLEILDSGHDLLNVLDHMARAATAFLAARRDTISPMMRRCFLPAGLLVFTAMAQPTQTVPDRLAKWKRVEMPFSTAGLSPRETQMVGKLVEACRLLDDIFWRQSDPAGLDLYKTTRDPALKQLLGIMGGRWDLLDNNRPFAGAGPMPPGHEQYPHDLTRVRVDQYIAQRPEDRAAIYNPYTVVKWRGGRLTGVPYHEEYKAFLGPAAQALREAAALSGDPAFANFLRLRAAALLTDDYYASDLAWLDLKNPKFDLIFAPYETYLDDLLAVKTSYGASVLIRNGRRATNSRCMRSTCRISRTPCRWGAPISLPNEGTSPPWK